MYVYFPGLLTTEVNGGANAPGMHLFPNPAVDEVTVERPTSDLCMLQLIDGQGRVVLNERHTGSRISLSLSDLAAGLYTVRMNTGNEVKMQRLVIGN